MSELVPGGLQEYRTQMLSKLMLLSDLLINFFRNKEEHGLKE